MTSSRSEDRVKVIFKLDKDEDGYPPVEYEGLWARPLGEGLYTLDNVPFFAVGVACGDIVSVTVEKQELQFREVVRPSGHSTLRVIVHDTKDISSLVEFLEHQGCAIERSHIPGLLSVDVPPTASLSVLRKALDEGEDRERWGYEEACLAST